MKLISWYKEKSISVKIIIVSIILISFSFLSFVAYLSFYHYSSDIYKICENEIEIGMDRAEVKKLIMPLVDDSFSNSGFDDKEDSLYLMDVRGVYCEVKVEDKKVIDYWWGVDAP